MAIALLLAAGRGERLGSERPKAFVELAGRPLLQWSLAVLAGVAAIERIAIALPPADDTPPGAIGLPEGISAPAGTVCVEGGIVRSESVRRALAAAGPGDPVLVHDAARPLLTAELVERTLAAVEAGVSAAVADDMDAATTDGVDGAIAATPVTDTIKRAAGEPPIVCDTLDRSGLWAVQTPQVFRRETLERALDVPEEVLAAATDDAWLVERAGGRVAIVPSSPENLKITTAVDLALAELLAGRA